MTARQYRLWQSKLQCSQRRFLRIHRSLRLVLLAGRVDPAGSSWNESVNNALSSNYNSSVQYKDRENRAYRGPAPVQLEPILGRMAWLPSPRSQHRLSRWAATLSASRRRRLSLLLCLRDSARRRVRRLSTRRYQAWRAAQLLAEVELLLRRRRLLPPLARKGKKANPSGGSWARSEQRKKADCTDFHSYWGHPNSLIEDVQDRQARDGLASVAREQAD